MLTQERLKQLFHYSPETGIFTRKSTGKPVVSGSGRRGKVIYQKILIDSKIYAAHRLAWLYFYGEIPSEQIDHIDGNGLNNKIENLRHVSQSLNMKNSTIKSNNSSGVTGVSWNNQYQVWRASISTDYGRLSLGSFKDFDDAVKARRDAERENGYHENHGRQRIFVDAPAYIEKLSRKAVVRIDCNGIANIISNGNLGKRQLINLKMWVDGNNGKTLIAMNFPLVNCKMALCEICNGAFYPKSSRHMVCSDKCKQRKHRQKIRDELELDDE